MEHDEGSESVLPVKPRRRISRPRDENDDDDSFASGEGLSDGEAVPEEVLSSSDDEDDSEDSDTSEEDETPPPKQQKGAHGGRKNQASDRSYSR